MRRIFLFLTLFTVGFVASRWLTSSIKPQKASSSLMKAQKVFSAKAKPNLSNSYTEKRSNHGGEKILLIRNLSYNDAVKKFLIDRLKEPNIFLRREALLKLKPHLSELPENERLRILAEAGPEAVHLATLSDAEIFQVFHVP